MDAFVVVDLVLLKLIKFTPLMYFEAQGEYCSSLVIVSVRH